MHALFRRQPSYRRSKLRQSGSMAVNMMLVLIALIGMLGLVEIGYLYWAKRDTQKTADLASLAGAQQLQDCSADNADNSAARGNATTENRFQGTLAISCGTWDPTANGGTVDHFSTTAAGTAPNAVKVIASRPVTPFLGLAGSLPNVSTEAVATQASPVAAFSIGTTLLNVNGAATLPQFLQSIGLNLNGTSLVGYQGLANVTITPSGLLKQLGVDVPANISVGDLNTLLAAQAQVQPLINVLNAIVTVGGQQQLTSANLTLVNAITAAVGNMPLNVTLGSATSNPSGLFAQIVGPDAAAQAALNTQVNALQLLNAAIGVATTGHAIYGSPITLSTPLGITVNASTSVIEPPSIGVGGIGTTAYTAQIRTFIDITTPNGPVSLLGGLITLSLNLPIAIDLVNAQATLTDLCNTTDSNGQPEATIAVNASVLKMCVGNITQAGAFSTALGCDKIPGASTPQQLFELSLGNVDLASLNTSIVTNALPASGSGTLAAGESAVIPAGGNPLDIGTSVNNLVSALTTALFANAATQPPANSSQTATQIATDLWNATNPSSTYLQRTQQALDQIQTASQGFQGVLGNVTTDMLDLLGNTVQLNVPGLLSSVSSLLNSVTGDLSQLLGDVGCAAGSSNACISVISSALPSGNGASSGAFVGLMSFLLQALQQPLDDIGSNVLSPVLTHTLGLELGENTVNMQSLQCHRVQLVY